MDTSNYVSFESILSGKSFKDLILLKDGKLDLSRFDALMRGVLEESIKSSNVPPHQLVRVIRDGRVIWMTVEQARNMVDYHRHHSIADTSATVANAIEMAINGDINYLEDEMLILMCLAESGNSKNDDVMAKFTRRKQEVFRLVNEIRDSESELQRRKRETNIVSDFEEKMGLMLQARHKGQEQRAIQLAQELRVDKKKYLLFARSLGPDIQKIRQLRGELVRTKEKVLGHIMEGVGAEANSLSLSIDSLKQNMDQLEKAFNQSAESMKVDNKYVEALKQKMAGVQKAIEKKTERIEAIEQEKAALQQEIEKTKLVADKLDTVNVEDGINDQLKKFQDSAPKIKKEPGLQALVGKQSASRMHIER
ncbi:MAG: hypothetical protein C4527_20875 [Candidatus Omnitrophota bacterium]|jgi:chromosome segregation ATPase|nr:MAG: hypothetical protein C4527_20875 [Candidatus Omnitrophota bacterium]